LDRLQSEEGIFRGGGFLQKDPAIRPLWSRQREYDEEGRVITLEYEDFYLVGAYVPNSGDGLKRLDFRMEFEKKMLEYLDSLNAKKPIIYTGDLNVAHQEIDLKNPKDNTHNPGFTKEERDAFSTLLSHGYADTFRRLHP
jgi:exodeoxyribonuclease-3